MRVALSFYIELQKEVFNGYKTKWRTNAPADAGRLIRYADRKGFEIDLTYDDAGHIVQMKGNRGARTHTGLHG